MGALAIRRGRILFSCCSLCCGRCHRSGAKQRADFAKDSTNTARRFLGRNWRRFCGYRNSRPLRGRHIGRQHANGSCLGRLDFAGVGRGVVIVVVGRKLVAFFLQGFVVSLGHADSFDGVVRCIQRRVGDDQQHGLVASLDLRDALALLVEQIGGNVHRYIGHNAAGVVLARFFLDQTKYRECSGLDAANGAVALAARTHRARAFSERGAQALAGHLEQSKLGNLADLHARAVSAQCFSQTILDLSLMLGREHVNEVDDHQTPKVTQAQLPSYFISGFQVGVGRGLLDVATLGGARRVDVDRNQGFGVVDYQSSAGGQAHFALESTLDLGLDLVSVE